MANNPTPKTIAELLDLAKLNIVGMNSVGAAIGLLQYTAANYQPLIDNLQTRQNAFNATRSVTAAAAAVVHTDLRVASRENDTGGWGFDGCWDGMMNGRFIGVRRLALARRARSPEGDWNAAPAQRFSAAAAPSPRPGPAG